MTDATNTEAKYILESVVEKRASNGARSESQWWCVCDCGRHALKLGTTLRRGTSQSCGCLKKEKCQSYWQRKNWASEIDKEFKSWGGSRAKK